MISRDGSTFVTENRDGVLRLWNARTGETLAHSDAGMLPGGRYSPDGTRIALGDQILDATTFDKLVELDASAEAVKPSSHSRRIAWSPDGERILTGDGDGRARIWDARTGKKLQVFEDRADQAGIMNVAWSNDGQHVAIESRGKTILRNLDDDSAGQVPTLSLPVGLNRLEFTPNGDKIVGSQRGFQIWNARPQRDLVELVGHTRPLVGLAFSPDGRFIASAEATGTIKIWDVNSRTAMKTIPGEDHINHIVWLHGGLIATATRDVADSPITIWDVSTGSIIKRLPHNPDVHDLSASPDGKYLAASSHYHGTVRVWDVETFTRLYEGPLFEYSYD